MTLIPILAALAEAAAQGPPPSLDDRLDKILAAVTAVVIFLGALVHLVLVARSRLAALVGAVKGTETALEPLKATHPTIYRATKDRLEAALEDEGVNKVIAPLVEAVIHGDGKPGTKPHTDPQIKAADVSGDAREDDR